MNQFHQVALFEAVHNKTDKINVKVNNYQKAVREAIISLIDSKTNIPNKRITKQEVFMLI